MWMDWCCGKKAGGRIKRAASGHRKHFAGPGSSPFFPPKVFFFSARKTNYQETLNSRERNLKAPKINTVDEKREREKRLIVREQT
jgi:hypothetical protein